MVWHVKGDDEVARKEVFAMICGDDVRIDEDVRERRSSITDIGCARELAKELAEKQKTSGQSPVSESAAPAVTWEEAVATS